MKTATRTDHPFGLDWKWYVDEDSYENRMAGFLSKYGFFAKTTSRITGLSIGAIAYRNKNNGVRIRDYRDGVGKTAETVIAHCKALAQSK